MFEKKFNNAGGRRKTMPVGIVLIVLFVLIMLCQPALADEIPLSSKEAFLEHDDWAGGHTYDLTTDIDMDGEEWAPVDFIGTFEGNGNTISNLKIGTQGSPERSYVGLFANVTDSEIKNLTLSGFEMYGYNNVGALAGNVSKSTLMNCSAIDVIIGGTGNRIGGLAGEVGSIDDESGTVLSSCFTTGSVVNTGNYTGGLFGYVYGQGAPVSMELCYSTADVSSDSGGVGGLIGEARSNDGQFTISEGYVSDAEIIGMSAGGLIADAWNITLIQSFADDVTVSTLAIGTGHAGGLIGYASGVNLIQSFADDVTVSVASGTGFAGGLIGYMYGEKITDCYANATVSSPYRVAGLVGYSYRGTIESSYFTGTVSILDGGNKGGITCSTGLDTYVNGCVYSDEAGEGLDNSLSTPASLSAMKEIANYQQEGEFLLVRAYGAESEPWDEEWSIAPSPSSESVWFIEEGVSLPQLYWYYELNEETDPNTDTDTTTKGGGSGTGQARVINSTSETPNLTNNTSQEPADTPDLPQTQTPPADNGQESGSEEGYTDESGGIGSTVYILIGIAAIIVIAGLAYLLFLRK